MLGIKSLIPPKTRERINPESYHKLLSLAWDAMEREGAKDTVNSNEELCLVLLAGKEADINKGDFTKVSLPKQL